MFARREDGTIAIVNKGRITDYEASIMLPKSLSDRLLGSGRSDAGLFLSFYDSGAMFPLKYNSTTLGLDLAPTASLDVSSVVAATFAGHELQNLQDDVIVTFKLGFMVTPNLTCASWDFGANGKLWLVLLCGIFTGRSFPRGAWQLGGGWLPIGFV